MIHSGKNILYILNVSLVDGSVIATAAQGLFDWVPFVFRNIMGVGSVFLPALGKHYNQTYSYSDVFGVHLIIIINIVILIIISSDLYARANNVCIVYNTIYSRKS